MTAGVINAINKLKSKLITQYDIHLRVAQRGYPLFEDSEAMIEAMYAIDYVTRFDLSEDEGLTIIQYHYYNIDGK